MIPESEPLLRLAHIAHARGDFEAAHSYIDHAHNAVLGAPTLNRMDISQCMKANYYIDENEYEKASSVLHKLDGMLGQEDVYSLLARARMQYLKSVAVRNDPIEQSRLLITFRKMFQGCCRTMQEGIKEKRGGK